MSTLLARTTTKSHYVLGIAVVGCLTATLLTGPAAAGQTDGPAVVQFGGEESKNKPLADASPGQASAQMVDPPAGSGAVVNLPGCDTYTMLPNDDQSSVAQDLPFEINFFGTTHAKTYVNNNGNISFNAPLADYTPWRLETAAAPIIAPFHADVDTRGTGSVTWGPTSFLGLSAFCVTWHDVGYYSSRVDKVNRFQLLLVQRLDQGAGAFDIVFNYDTLNWETGEADLGVVGLGGRSARAGYSAGTGATGSHYEIAGSGMPGRLIDSDAAYGLAHRRAGSELIGRFIFPIRARAAQASNYVAMGDSYQSGEGAFREGTNLPDYLSGTNLENYNLCHRSANAYANAIWASAEAKNLGADGQFHFVACSGARLTDILRDAQYLSDDPPRKQLDPLGRPESQTHVLDSNTRLVTIGIGGNDLEWAAILRYCMLGPLQGDWLPCTNPGSLAAAQAAASMNSLKTGADQIYVNGIVAEPAFMENVLVNGRKDSWRSLRTNLEAVLKDIAVRAPNAEIYVVGYPPFFPKNGGVANICALLNPSKRLWINSLLGEAIPILQTIVNLQGPRFHFVDVRPEFLGYELCNTTGNPEALNSQVIENPGYNCTSFPACPESFHPNGVGHRLMTTSILRVMREDRRGSVSTVTATPIVVPFASGSGGVTPRVRAAGHNAASATLTAVITWDGLDSVDATLTSPSGTVFTMSDASENVPGRIVFEVPDEQGNWDVTISSQFAPVGGIPVSIDVFSVPAPNQPPVAVTQVTRSGNTVTADSVGSGDADGSIVQYMWDMGDGTTLSGASVTHTYTDVGTWSPTLLVRDDDGAVTVATSSVSVTISPNATPGGAGAGSAGTSDGSATPGLTNAPTAAPTSGREPTGTTAPSGKPIVPSFQSRWLTPKTISKIPARIAKRLKASSSMMIVVAGAGTMSTADRAAVNRTLGALVKAGVPREKILFQPAVRMPQKWRDRMIPQGRIVILFNPNHA